MAKFSLKVGTTSKRLRIFVQDSSQTIIAGLSGLLFSTAGISAYYIREGDATVTAITLVDKTVGTYVSGGFKQIDATNMKGVYEFDVPNAAFASGASVDIYVFGAVNMSPVVLEIELTAVDNQDAVRGGLSALPSVAAGANGGLPTGDASGRVLLQPTQTGVTIPTVTTVGTLTTYTGNTPQTGDAFARIGAAGAGLVALGDTRIANLDAAVSSRSTYAGADTSGVGTLLTRIPGIVQAQTGDAFARLGAAGAGLTALGDTRIANLDTPVSTRSVFAGGAVASVATPVALSTADEAILTSLRAMVVSNVFTAPALALAPTGGSAPTAAAIRAEIDTNSTQLAAIVAKTTNLPASPAAVGSAMTLDLTQAVPTTNTAQTIGDALNAARAQGFGKWVVNAAATPPTITLYAANGTTVLRTFNLDSATAPTSRS
jgi:hypothetical protein